MTYTVFLDRDGVINMDSPDYIKTPDEFNFIPKSAEAVARLSQNGYRVIIITNQSLIGRKMATQETLDAIFQKMKDGVAAAGGRISDIFFCPHTPKEGCNCRKPSPGMILDAQKKHGIDLNLACMVGDSAKDIECGRNAGCSATVLVKTGNGKAAEQTLSQENRMPDHLADDLHDAVNWIIENLTV